MARTKSTSAKEDTKQKKADFTLKGDGYTIDFYVRDGKKINAKITTGCFVIYAKVVYNDNYAFLSYPSFKNKDGKFINQAFCFDAKECKNITTFINKMLDDLGF